MSSTEQCAKTGDRPRRAPTGAESPSKTISLRYNGFNGRPDDYLKLHTPTFKTVYGTRIFEYYATRLWNELPIALREEDDVVKYKKLLKTLLFEGYNELKKKAFKYKS